MDPTRTPTAQNHRTGYLAVIAALLFVAAAPANAAPKNLAKKNISLGPWYTTGALPAKSFSQAMFPEQAVDLKAKGARGKALWTQQRRWADGVVHKLNSGNGTATYLYRTITAKQNITVTGGFGSDDGLTVWLNGKRILSNNVSRGPGADQDKAKLALRKGANQLLLRIYNKGGGCGFFFRVVELTKARASRAAGSAVHTESDITPESLRRAITDLAKTFPKRYAKGSEYLTRLDALEKAEQPDTEKLAALGREALLANPLLDFGKLLVVRRKAGNRFLVNNWLSNTNLPKGGHDNDIAVLSPLKPDGKLTTLFRPAGGVFVGDVDLDSDAKKMLFSMPTSSRGRWQVFQINADPGAPGALKQLTPGDQPDVDNYDACYLPNGRIMFTSTANMQGVPCIGGGGHVANLAVCDPGSKQMRMLAFEQDHDWCPTVTNDGRVMYQRWEYTDTPHYFTRLMMTMNPDGTNQAALYGSNSYWPNALFFARPIPNHPTKFVGIVGGHHDHPRMGEMIIFDPAKGRHEADGVVQRIPGYGKEVPPIIRDGLVRNSWPLFIHPFPLSEKYYLVSRPVTRGSKEWAIFLVDIFDNMLVLKHEPGYALVEPVPFRATKKPPVIANRVNPARKDSVLFISNIYEGPGLKDVPRGAVKKLRIFTYTYGYRGMGGHACFGIESGWDAKRILGTVPVEADGSAVFLVPANTPISLQPLDEDGRALQLMRSWLTAMPGETLSCIGCHESQNDVTPSRMMIASKRVPSQIKTWNGPPRGFGFNREVQPVLDKYCVGCHDGKKPGRPNLMRGGMRNAYGVLQLYVRRPGPESDYHLLRPMEYHSSTSELMQMLCKGHHNVKLPPEAWDRLNTWIDLNIPYHASWTEVRRGKIGPIAKRYRDLQKLYAGVDVDPEALPPMPTEAIKPVMPEKENPVEVAIPQVPGWPFDAKRAAELQAAAGEKTTETVDLADGVTMTLTRIPAGEFVMGDVGGDLDERQVAHVKIYRPFLIGTLEVTNAQYAAFDPAHDSRYIDMAGKDQGHPGFRANDPSQPVIRVSWKEAMAFCQWLSKKTGRKFTLPTEAQWEWACRAGTATALSYGDVGADFSKHANVADKSAASRQGTSSGRLTPFIADKTFADGQTIACTVGRYAPNPWGLKDMHGNVAEWTRGDYKAYPYIASDGRNGLSPTARKVARGGSWHDRPKRCRSAFRLPYEPYQKVFNVGFRVVCED